MDTLRQSQHKVFFGVLGVIILVAGIGGGVIFVKTKPKAKKRPPIVLTPVVDTMALVPTNDTVVINAMGTVIPAKEVNIQPDLVSGRVVWVAPDFVAGGIFHKDEVLLKIDDSDYKLTLQQQKEKLKIDESNLALEKGRQTVARQECEMLQQGKSCAPIKQADMDLALRKPQLEIQQALVASAKVAVEKSELMLARTEIKVPFDAVVKNADVNIGDQVSPAKILGRLVYTGVYWVQVSVKISDLHWVSVGNKDGVGGSFARVVLTGGRIKDGMVIKRLPDLELHGRMARLLIAVKNPFQVNTADGRNVPMLLDEYVRVRIYGPKENGVYRIPREALRENNKLWLLTKDGHLKVIDAKQVWTDRNTVTVYKNWDEGSRLIVSDLDVVVDGMKLRDVNDADYLPMTQDMLGNDNDKVLTIRNTGDK